MGSRWQSRSVDVNREVVAGYVVAGHYFVGNRDRANATAGEFAIASSAACQELVAAMFPDLLL